MLSTLSSGAIGVAAPDLGALIGNAHRHGFGGVEFSAVALAEYIDTHGGEAAHAMFVSRGVLPAVFGPPDFRGDEAAWRAAIELTPRVAVAAYEVGCKRAATWIMPCSNEREFEANLRWHVERIQPIADALGERGIWFGLEFVGPKTLRDTQKFPFVHTLEGMLEMGEKIGPNVGLLLDSFHWFTSGGTVEQLDAVPVERIVYVHLNDAMPGRSPDEQIDGERDLPGATGVIDLAGFIGALKRKKYRGPVAVEPFKASLRDLPDDDARLHAVKTALDATLAL